MPAVTCPHCGAIAKLPLFARLCLIGCVVSSGCTQRSPKTIGTTAPNVPAPVIVARTPVTGHSESFTRGIAAYEARRFDEAIDLFTKAIQERPNYPKAYRNRAGVFWAKAEILPEGSRERDDCLSKCVTDYDAAFTADPGLATPDLKQIRAIAAEAVKMTADQRPSPSGREVARTLRVGSLSHAVFLKAKNEADKAPLFGGDAVRVVGVVDKLQREDGNYLLFLADDRPGESNVLACQMLVPGNGGKDRHPTTERAVLAQLQQGQKICVVGVPRGTYPTIVPVAYLAFCELETDCPY